MRYMPVEPMVSHSFTASLSTRNRRPQNCSISGMNGSDSSSPCASRVARISASLRTSTISPTRRLSTWPTGASSVCTAAPLSGRPWTTPADGLLRILRGVAARARATALSTTWLAASGRRAALVRLRPRGGARRLRIGGLVHRLGQRRRVPRVDDDPVHAVVHDRADRPRHRRRHHRRTRAHSPCHRSLNAASITSSRPYPLHGIRTSRYRCSAPSRRPGWRSPATSAAAMFARLIRSSRRATPSPARTTPSRSMLVTAAPSGTVAGSDGPRTSDASRQPRTTDLAEHTGRGHAHPEFLADGRQRAEPDAERQRERSGAGLGPQDDQRSDVVGRAPTWWRRWPGPRRRWRTPPGRAPATAEPTAFPGRAGRGRGSPRTGAAPRPATAAANTHTPWDRKRSAISEEQGQRNEIGRLDDQRPVQLRARVRQQLRELGHDVTATGESEPRDQPDRQVPLRAEHDLDQLVRRHRDAGADREQHQVPERQDAEVGTAQAGQVLLDAAEGREQHIGQRLGHVVAERLEDQVVRSGVLAEHRGAHHTADRQGVERCCRRSPSCRRPTGAPRSRRPPGTAPSGARAAADAGEWRTARSPGSPWTPPTPPPGSTRRPRAGPGPRRRRGSRTRTCPPRSSTGCGSGARGAAGPLPSWTSP